MRAPHVGEDRTEEIIPNASNLKARPTRVLWERFYAAFYPLYDGYQERINGCTACTVGLRVMASGVSQENYGALRNRPPVKMAAVQCGVLPASGPKEWGPRDGALLAACEK